MTKVRFEGPIGGFSGSMGKMVFADRKKKDKTIAYMKSKQDPTEWQLEQKARFLEAAGKADEALKDPETQAFYQTIADQRDSTPRNMAIGEFLARPSFKPLDLSGYKGQVGNVIVIRAKDPVGLAEVKVDIHSQSGALIEQGKAVGDAYRSGFWRYTATQPVALGSDIFIKLSGVNYVGTAAQLTENPTVGAD